MATLERAIEIAHEAHKDATRRNGEPYVTHPLAVMESAKKLGYSVTRLIIAALHDVSEDNPEWPIERIRAEGFGDDVLEPLQLLTKKESENYFDYIKRIEKNDDAVAVKILDMRHNLGDNPTEYQVRKYTRALAYLAAKHTVYN